MYTYQIWDKNSEINGVGHEIILKNNPAYKNTGVVLYIHNSNQMVEVVALETELRRSYNDANSSLEELALIRLDALNGDKPKTVKELQNKISILQEQNANLLLDNAKKEIEINGLNKNLANVTLEIAKIKGGM